MESSCDNSSQLPATLYPEVSQKEILTTKLFKTFMNITQGRNLEKHPGKLLVLCTFSIKSRNYGSKEVWSGVQNFVLFTIIVYKVQVTHKQIYINIFQELGTAITSCGKVYSEQDICSKQDKSSRRFVPAVKGLSSLVTGCKTETYICGLSGKVSNRFLIGNWYCHSKESKMDLTSWH